MEAEPVASVIVANYNGSRFLKQLFKCLLRQTLASLEIIFIDDASTDNSVSLANAARQADPRIRVQVLPANAGPAAARNAGLALARGQWIAIVDSDDLIHARRLERLITVAEAQKADIIADDLFVFYEDGGMPHRFLKGTRKRRGGAVSLEKYIGENAVLTRKPALGYLKPLFRREALDKHRLRYNESLRIGEDYDFVLRGLMEGLKLWIEPEPLYLYRKHAQSISHRLANADIERIIEGDRMLVQQQRAKGIDLSEAFRIRQSSLERAKDWNDLVETIKARKMLTAGGLLLKRPSLLPLLTLPIRARLKRALDASTSGQVARGKSVCFLSRQRLVSAVSGSARYVLSLAAALRDAGYEVHLVQPSPTVFGRLPLLVRRSESRAFKTMRVRGGVTLGPFLVAKDPRIFAAFFRGVIARLARKAGLNYEDQPAAYSVASPWTAEDYLFAARHTRSSFDTIVFDYAFQTDAAPYVMRPDAKSFVLMHDLISSRAEQFVRLGSQDSLPAIDEAEELRLLTGADVVVAIQEEEATFVRTRTRDREVLCVPFAVQTVERPQVGANNRILFVGTKTAPNVVGLNWFLSEVWPLIVTEVPAATLDVAGSVNRVLSNVPRNVRMLGVVPDLNPLYEAAGVVISPLRSGSGLKIKLIEALAHGKAIVCTSETLQGVSAAIGSAVLVADDPEAFARAVIELMQQETFRARQAALALDAAGRIFSPDACYKSFLAAITAPARSPNTSEAHHQKKLPSMV